MIKMDAGFTLFEVVIVVLILSILAAIVVADFLSLQKKSDLEGSANEIATVLRLAQSRTVASESSSKYGVYFDNLVSPNKYVLFKGTSYTTREVGSDQTYFFPNTLEFSSVSLSDGNETVFEKLTGASEKSGSVTIRFKADASQTKTVYISSSGVIDFNPPSGASDTARVKDSRHIHFDYSRVINTASENLVLTFDNTVVQTIPISQNLAAGQIYWSGTVSAGGSDQVVTVRTHRLNNPDTQFSFHRDRRFNNKTLKVTVSGDASGSLVEYAADGSTTSPFSIYVSSLNWQ